jgi:hypothetical protein
MAKFWGLISNMINNNLDFFYLFFFFLVKKKKKKGGGGGVYKFTFENILLF